MKFNKEFRFSKTNIFVLFFQPLFFSVNATSKCLLPSYYVSSRDGDSEYWMIGTLAIRVESVIVLC